MKDTIKKFYKSRGLQGVEVEMINDIHDVLTKSYTRDKLIEDFNSWCMRNEIEIGTI